MLWLGYFLLVHIPTLAKREVARFLKKVASQVPGLHVVDVDIPVDMLCKDDHKLDQVALGREFHVSLGRTVPIRVHQIDSVVTMLRQKLQAQRWFDQSFQYMRSSSIPKSKFPFIFLIYFFLWLQTSYWIDFGRWEVFVNDDKTRSFLSLEVIAGGLAEVFAS